MTLQPARSPLFPYTTLFRSRLLYSDIIEDVTDQQAVVINRSRQASMLLPGQSLLICEMAPALFAAVAANEAERAEPEKDRKSTRLNSSHTVISYAVFCLKKK